MHALLRYLRVPYYYILVAAPSPRVAPPPSRPVAPNRVRPTLAARTVVRRRASRGLRHHQPDVEGRVRRVRNVRQVRPINPNVGVHRLQDLCTLSAINVWYASVFYS